MELRRRVVAAAATCGLVAAVGCAHEPSVVARQPSTFQSEMPRTPDEVSEAEICRSLDGARFGLQDTTDGVLLTIGPTDRTDLFSVHHGARQLERALTGPSYLIKATPEEGDCDLADVARQRPGSVIVEQTSEGARVRIRSTDPARVDAIRRDVRDFIDELD